ncbi:putative Cullin-associated NEDD8-dissociated protein 1 [Paratrimastix pyriformis]|uniref:Cullin-associated NEDD8-dissociated protein 1 n=1 Tax=Paratrimastix pyriformis TaxID=342808 RepID=A0ABQ8UUC3_9EUKA|nr:putative Cullin-associated NEDD8-dissociated protein 1 [Paratrimastix pyriformis]
MCAAAAQQPFAVQTILDRINNNDRDISHVGLTDLNALLKNENFKALADWEERIVNIVLTKLGDQSGTIQNLATICLGSLCARGLREPFLDRVCTKLMDLLLSLKPEERSVGQSALKSVIADCPHSMAHVVIRCTAQRLLTGIPQSGTQLFCLETLVEVMRKFGNAMHDDHPRIQDCLIQTLQSAKSDLLRRKTIAALAILSCFINNTLFEALLSQYIAAVDQPNKAQKRVGIQLIGAISREAGARASDHLDRLVPLLIGATRHLSTEGNDDEIRESCIEACHSFIQKCSTKKVAPHLAPITEFCLANLSYDPNYQADDEEDEDAMDKDEDDESGEDASDDEDMSWKSRRAAARCLATIIRMHPEMLNTLYQRAAAPLIERFKERVDHVRLSIFAAFDELLGQTERNMRMALVDGLALLRPHAGPAVTALCALMVKSKHVETKTAAMNLIKSIATVLNGGLDAQFGQCATAVVKLCKTKGVSAQVRTTLLECFGTLCSLHPAPVVAPHTALLMPVLLAAIGDAYYKLAAEALRCVAAMVKTVRPLPGPAGALQPHAKPVFAAVLARLNQPDQDQLNFIAFSLARLQEVKQAAIACMGTVISQLGDELVPEVHACLPTLLERCRNEITRPGAVRALLDIARSPLHVDFAPILAPLLVELASFLRKRTARYHRLLARGDGRVGGDQSALGASGCCCLPTCQVAGAVVAVHSGVDPPPFQTRPGEKQRPHASDATPLSNNRALVQTSIATLEELVKSYGASLKAPQTQSVLNECATLVNERDLHLASLSLGLVVSILNAQSAALPQCKGTLLPAVLALTQSPLLQGAPLAAVLNFLTTLVRLGEPAQGYLNSMLSSITPATPQHAYGSIAQCVGALAVHAGAPAVQTVVQRFLSELKASAPTTLFALLCLGEIGRLQDVSAFGELRETVLAKLDAPSEEVQLGASFCLGNLAVGAMAQYVPLLFQLLNTHPKWQYLLMHSVKELIVRQAAAGAAGKTAMEPFVDQFSAMLLQFLSTSGEEGVRNTASECLGRLTVLRPEAFLTLFESNATSPSANVRFGIAHALKYTIAEGSQPVDTVLAARMGNFVRLLQDPDLAVRRELMLLIKSLLTIKPRLVRDVLPQVVPIVLAETAVKTELRRVVECGPFKEVMDDGLPLRKATYDCLEVLLNVLPELVDLGAAVRCVVGGIGDDYDVAIRAHAMMLRLVELVPDLVLAQMAPIAATEGKSLDKLMKAIANPNTVKQEAEKHEDFIKGILHLVAAIESVPGHEQSAEFMTFMTQKVLTATVKPRFDAVKAEKEAASKPATAAAAATA